MNKYQNLVDSVNKELPFVPLPEQTSVIENLCDFITNRNAKDIFLLKGFAGTGKTSLTGAFVRALKKHEINCVLLAPTGRAAKVFSNFAGSQASTIHKRIYRGNGDDFSSYFLAQNKDKDTIFIVDEASMIGDENDSYSLLDSLIHHVYSSQGCSMIIIGDTAQLPPVGQTDSPAMNEDRLRQAGLQPITAVLSKPVRQAATSGILHNATRIRLLLEKGYDKLPSLRTSPFSDIEPLSSEFFLETLSDSYSRVGLDETIVITRSNRMATEINRAIRARIMYAETELQRDDRLVISKNNYYWNKENKEPGFIANGEIATVDWFGNTEKKYGYNFTEAELHFNGKEAPITAKIFLDNLLSDKPALTIAEQKDLLRHIMQTDYPDSTTNADTMSAELRTINSNPYYNALQVKYAYALTCHKAQGGQWKHVYIDVSYINPELNLTDFFRWLYTAITRATEKVYLINPSLRCI